MNRDRARDEGGAPPGAPPMQTPSPRGPREAGWKVVVAWLVVGVPAAWGVAQVIVKSLALFR